MIKVYRPLWLSDELLETWINRGQPESIDDIPEEITDDQLKDIMLLTQDISYYIDRNHHSFILDKIIRLYFTLIYIKIYNLDLGKELNVVDNFFIKTIKNKNIIKKNNDYMDSVNNINLSEFYEID